jgi:hypothetical protein
MRAAFLISIVLFVSSAFAQNPRGDMADMDMTHMAGHDQGVRAMSDSDGNAAAMHSMEGHHMDMGPHMKMTTLREAQPGDQEKADQIVQAARVAADKYKDYKVALADGYKIFLPNVEQKQYHFTNYWNSFRARNNFDPSRPTSLLYEKKGDWHNVHRAERYHGGRTQLTDSIEYCAVARAREFVHASERPQTGSNSA